jgi:hypothetical protein
MPSASPKLIIVKRGKQGTYELLTRWMRDIPGTDVIWDRRIGSDRRQRNGSAPVEARVKERRQHAPQGNVFTPSATDVWSVYWYIATQVSRHQPAAAAPAAG